MALVVALPAPGVGDLAGTDDPAGSTASGAFFVERKVAVPFHCPEADSVTVETHAGRGAGGAQTVGPAEIGIG